MDPHVVEVVQNSLAWWQLWLPLGCAVLLAAVATGGVISSNRTNRRAIMAADARSRQALDSAAEQLSRVHEEQFVAVRHQVELARDQLAAARTLRERGFEQWRHTAIAEVVNESLGMSGRIADALRRDTDWTDELLGDFIKELQDCSDRANILRIVASDVHYKRWRALAETLSDALLSALTLQRRRIEQAATEHIDAARQHKSTMLGEVQAAEYELIDQTRVELGLLTG